MARYIADISGNPKYWHFSPHIYCYHYQSAKKKGNIVSLSYHDKKGSKLSYCYCIGQTEEQKNKNISLSNILGLFDILSFLIYLKK